MPRVDKGSLCLVCVSYLYVYEEAWVPWEMEDTLFGQYYHHHLLRSMPGVLRPWLWQTRNFWGQGNHPHLYTLVTTGENTATWFHIENQCFFWEQLLKKLSFKREAPVDMIGQIPLFRRKTKLQWTYALCYFHPTEMLWLICIYDEEYFTIENNPKQKIAPGQQHKTNFLPDVILNGWDIKTLKNGVYNGNTDRLLTIETLL